MRIHKTVKVAYDRTFIALSSFICVFACEYVFPGYYADDGFAG